MTATATRVDASRDARSLDRPNSQVFAGQAEVEAELETAQCWAAGLVRESLHAKCTAIGLISGSRFASPRCVVDAYATDCRLRVASAEPSVRC